MKKVNFEDLQDNVLYTIYNGRTASDPLSGKDIKEMEGDPEGDVFHPQHWTFIETSMFQFEAGYMFQFKDTTPVDTMKDVHLDGLNESIESAKASAAKLVCQSSELKPDDLEGIYKVIITLEKVR